jgi:hypothetical protein
MLLLVFCLYYLIINLIKRWDTLLLLIKLTIINTI